MVPLTRRDGWHNSLYHRHDVNVSFLHEHFNKAFVGFGKTDNMIAMKNGFTV